MKDRLQKYGPVLATYLLVTWFTNADFMGDTVDYVSAIILMRQGEDRSLWEFAHLLWRPFGWVFSLLVTPLTRLFVGDNEHANATLQLLTVSWFAGLFMVFLACERSLRPFSQHPEPSGAPRLAFRSELPGPLAAHQSPGEPRNLLASSRLHPYASGRG